MREAPDCAFRALCSCWLLPLRQTTIRADRGRDQPSNTGQSTPNIKGKQTFSHALAAPRCFFLTASQYQGLAQRAGEGRYHRLPLARSAAYLGELARAGGHTVVLRELGGWECVEMVPKHAHLSSEHPAEYVDRMSGLKLVKNGDSVTISLTHGLGALAACEATRAKFSYSAQSSTCSSRVSGFHIRRGNSRMSPP